MSGLEATLGLALATTTALVIIMLANGKDPMQLSNRKTKNNSLLDPNGEDVQFILFTRERAPFNLKTGNEKNFKHSGYNFSNPTKIVIHGFSSNIGSKIVTINRDAYLSIGDYNVIGVDWSVLCEFEYLSALRSTQIAGDFLAKFINWLIYMGESYENIHLIGHSLGAHVAGIAGSKVKGGKIGRISGLDPAAPGYNDSSTENKLDRNDAQLVDIIHTYMKILGLPQPLGHVDFYPNGGKLQPGCPDIYDIWKVTESLSCNHARAYWYFEETIRNKRAFKCNQCQSVDDALHSRCNETTNIYMGQAETYKHGLYYVKTKAQSPFSFT